MHEYEGTDETCSHCGCYKWNPVHFPPGEDYRKAAIAALQQSLRERDEQLAAVTKERDEAKKDFADQWRQKMRVVDAVKSPDKLFASQLECAAADAVRAATARAEAAEGREAKLKAGINEIKQITVDTDHDSISTSWLYDQCVALLVPAASPPAGEKASATG